jgi:peptide/nickel transport system ATP-binding protein
MRDAPPFAATNTAPDGARTGSADAVTGGTAQPLVRVVGLQKHFPIRGSTAVVKAVDDVTFSLGRRKIVGLVGESGSGKTTVGRTLLRLIEPTGGRIEFEGRDIVGLPAQEMRALRKKMQIIFQDPYSSLNPRMRVQEIIGEALTAQAPMARGEQHERIADLLQKVGLRPDMMTRWPHEFSGGQRQRVGIARALAVDPAFIVADESVSALDVSVQAQVLNLLKDLQEELGLTILFIAHDLAVVDYLCDEIIVMYLGRVMEIAPSSVLIDSPRHPYTQALLSAAPIPVPGAHRNRILLKADIPSPIDQPSGCVFRTRCPQAIAACAETVPPLTEVAPGHFKACIRD